jgi:hypothetical protein
MAKKKNTPKVKVENTPTVEKFEPVAGLTSAKPLNESRYSELMGTNYVRQSSAKPAPVDEEGLPYLQTHEISALYGVHPDSVKRWTHTREIPHYVEQKGMGRRTEGTDPMDVDSLQRGTRTWFKHSEVVDFLNDQGHLAGPTASAHLDRMRGEVTLRKRAGEEIRTLGNDPHHPTLKDRLIHFKSGRRVTEDLTPPDLTRDQHFEVGMHTSNIMDALRSGSGRPIGHTDEDFWKRTGL